MEAEQENNPMATFTIGFTKISAENFFARLTDEFEPRFFHIMGAREIEKGLKPERLQRAYLLCSEEKSHQCHRRLVIDYLNDRWGRSLEVKHL